MNSENDSLAVKTINEHSGISTIRLNIVIVTPKLSPKPGMMFLRFLILFMK